MNHDKMTKEQVEAKFKDATVSFDSYYKYTFHFLGSHDGYRISTRSGEDPDEIYRMSVGTEPVGFLPLSTWTGVSITWGDVEVFSS